MNQSAALLACALLASGTVLADTITLKDGNVMKCRIIRFANDTYFLEPTAGWDKNIPASQVKSIEFDANQQSNTILAPRQHDSWSDNMANRPIKAATDCEWFKIALASKPVTMKLSAITSSQVSMAGKLVKFVFQARMDMRQVGDNLFSARVVDDGWDLILTVSFGKDGLDFMERATDRQRRFEQNISSKYTCYGIIINDDMKRDLSNKPWEVGDVFLVGKTAKKAMGSDANTIAW